MIVLTASSGLGTYVPSVQFRQAQLARGFAAELVVLESLYTDDKLDRLVAFRRRFQDDFRYALAAKGFVKLHSMADNLCPRRIADLLTRWHAAGERRFVVFSGFWLPVLADYRDRVGGELDVTCVQLEAVLSPSWQAHLDDFAGALEIRWLFGGPNARPLQLLAPPALPGERAGRLVVHGGGWQIGEHAGTIDELRGAGYGVLAGRADPTTAAPGGGVDYFCVDPQWETWRAAGRYPAILHDHGAGFATVSDGSEHWLLGQIASSLAIVSKPGGGTLLDSLATATPLIWLTPYGDTELANAELWQALGFALDFDTWRRTGFARQPLADMRQRLEAARAGLPIYAHDAERSAPCNLRPRSGSIPTASSA